MLQYINPIFEKRLTFRFFLLELGKFDIDLINTPMFSCIYKVNTRFIISFIKKVIILKNTKWSS